MTHRLTAVLLLLLIPGITTTALGQDQKKFDAKDYPASSFQVTRQDYPLGELTVRIVQAKRKSGDHSSAPTTYCSASLEVIADRRVTKRLSFHDIEPVGFSFGIFVPELQPIRDSFVAVKEGDYDGRLLVVGKDGSLIDVAGGFYFLTPDKRYLIGDYASDSSFPVVFDTALRKVIIDGGKLKLPSAYQWYLDDIGYFFTEEDETGQARQPSHGRVMIDRLDLEHHDVKKMEIPLKHLMAARKVQYDFDPRQMKDCTSVQQKVQ